MSQIKDICVTSGILADSPSFLESYAVPLSKHFPTFQKRCNPLQRLELLRQKHSVKSQTT
jgi:hypothetical protein